MKLCKNDILDLEYCFEELIEKLHEVIKEVEFDPNLKVIAKLEAEKAELEKELETIQKELTSQSNVDKQINFIEEEARKRFGISNLLELAVNLDNKNSADIDI